MFDCFWTHIFRVSEDDMNDTVLLVVDVPSGFLWK